MSYLGNKPTDIPLTSVQLADNIVIESKVAANAVTSAGLANDSVKTNNIIDLAVTESKLAVNSVTTAVIAGGAVQANNLADTGVIADTYGGETAIPVIVVDAQGRLTSVANVAVNIPAGYENANAIPTILMLSGI